jgi:hypothetical protein
MPKWLKMIVAILLLPVCYGAGVALWKLLLNAGGEASSTWLLLLGGAVCWVIVFVLLPKPMLIYVFGHELTHAIWTWIFGGKVKKFKASSSGGHVIVTKTNFIIALSPYFFPLYSLLTVAVYFLACLFWHGSQYVIWFYLALGASYAFHVTLTWHILKTEQTDITEHGYIFSAVIIFLGNALVMLIALPLLGSHVGYLDVGKWWVQGTADAFNIIAALCSGKLMAR